MKTYHLVLTALADPTRRTLFERLRGQPLCVSDLAADLPISRPAVSQHLKVLKKARLVSEQAQGTRRFYRVSSEGLRALRDYLDVVWDDVLDSFQTIAEQEAKKNE